MFRGKNGDNLSKKKIKERFNRSNVLSGIAVCFALSFTVGFFSPMDIFLASQADFIVGYKPIVFPMLIFSLAVFAALMYVLFLFLLIHENLFHVFKNLYFGGLLAMYTQMLLYNGRMKTITGDPDPYFEMNVYNYINAFVYFFLLFIPIIIWYAKREYKDNKFLKKFSSKTIAFLSLAIAAVQLVGNVSMVFSYGLDGESSDDGNLLGMLSYDEAMKLSDKENVVVFLTDRLDSLWMDNVIEEYPEVNELFNGFTFYQNNVSTYTNTYPSVPELLTGYKFSGQQVEGYLSSAWGGDNLMRTLKQDGFRINLLIDGITTFNNFNDIKSIADTYEVIESDYSINYLGENGVVPTMLDFSLLKVSPYFLKGMITQKYSAAFANDFYIIDGDIPERMESAVSVQTDIDFYNYLRTVGLNTSGGEKTFNFIHLNCSHDPSADESALYPDYSAEKKAPDELTTTRGAFVILDEYFTQMKELGIYDSSTIIVVGDHGRPPYAVQDGADHLDDVITTGLLIKKANAENLPLKKDSESELSNSFFNASILEYCGLDHSEYGISYDDVISGDMNPDRIIHIYNWRGSGTTPDLICEYKIQGNARDFDNWQYIKVN